MLLLLWWWLRFSSSIASGVMAFMDGVDTCDADAVIRAIAAAEAAPNCSGLLVRRWLWLWLW